MPNKVFKRTRCKMPLELQIFAEPGTGSGDGGTSGAAGGSQQQNSQNQSQNQAGGQQGVQGVGNSGDVQLQQAQQAAEEDQQGEDHEEQVVGQGGGLLGHPVEEVSFNCFGQEFSREGFCD